MLALVGWVYGLHARIETQDEIVEVKAKPQSVSNSNLLIKLIPLKLTAGLLGIVTQSPDIARINEHSTVELPEQVRTELCVEVEFHVTRLDDEVDTTIMTAELSRSELTDAPSAH